MASRRCLKCGYPLTAGASCFCGTPTTQKRELTPYKPSVTEETPDNAEPEERTSYERPNPKVRITRLPRDERKRANRMFLEAERTLRLYKEDRSKHGLLFTASRMLLNLKTRYPDAIKNPDVFHALEREVRDEERAFRDKQWFRHVKRPGRR